MRTNTETSRVTVDFPKEIHRMLKAKAALVGKSMREIIVESVDRDLRERSYVSDKEAVKVNPTAKKSEDLMHDESIKECKRSHVPNKETVKAISDAAKGKGLTHYKNLEELFKKLGL